VSWQAANALAQQAAEAQIRCLSVCPDCRTPQGALFDKFDKNNAYVMELPYRFQFAAALEIKHGGALQQDAGLYFVCHMRIRYVLATLICSTSTRLDLACFPPTSPQR